MISAYFTYVYPVVLGVGWVTVFACPRRRMMRGIHVSRPLVRRVGQGRAWAVFGILSVVSLALFLVSERAARIAISAQVAWMLDDWMTGDDDDKDKRGVLASVRKWIGALRPLDYSTSTAPARA